MILILLFLPSGRAVHRGSPPVVRRYPHHLRGAQEAARGGNRSAQGDAGGAGGPEYDESTSRNIGPTVFRVMGKHPKLFETFLKYL